MATLLSINGPTLQRSACFCLRFVSWYTGRQLTTSATCRAHDRSYLGRQSKMLNKMMTGSKRKWYNFDKKVEKPQIGGAEFLKPAKVKNPLRVKVLNTIMVRYITDLIASGEVIPEIIGRGVEITRVKINQDYTCLNIYWLTSKPEESFTVEKLLHHYSGKLRSMLCSHNVIGNVPYVIFVKDQYQKHIADVEALLANADFGDDFEPIDSSHHIKSAIILKQSLPDIPEIQELEIREPPSVPDLKDDDLCILTADESTCKEGMRMDILGIDHNAILHQVRKKLNQSMALHRIFEATDDSKNTSLEEGPSPTVEKMLPSKNISHVSLTPMSSSDITQFLKQKRKLIYMERKLKAKALPEQGTSQAMTDYRPSYPLCENDEDDFFSDYDDSDYVLEEENVTDSNYD